MTLLQCSEFGEVKYAMYSGVPDPFSATICSNSGSRPRRALRFWQPLLPLCRTRWVLCSSTRSCASLNRMDDWKLLVSIYWILKTKICVNCINSLKAFYLFINFIFILLTILQDSLPSQSQIFPLSTQWKPQLMGSSSPTLCLTTSRVGESDVTCIPLVWRDMFTTRSTTRVAR